MPDNANIAEMSQQKLKLIPLEEIIGQVGSLTGDELENFYIKICGKDGFLKVKNNREMLRRRICYEIQKQRYGGLSTKHYNQLYKLTNEGQKEVINKFQTPSGTTLTRKWHGEFHRVQVTEAGIEYNQKIYKSLSAVAKEITGHERSGPAFFGLNNQEAA